jgi:hypothetical protein
VLKFASAVAHDAEIGEGGFNEAIAALSAGKPNNDDTVRALERGKVKNRVLKLQLRVLSLQVDAKLGNEDQAEIEKAMAELDEYVKLDQAGAGRVSVGVARSYLGTSNAVYNQLEDLEADHSSRCNQCGGYLTSEESSK